MKKFNLHGHTKWCNHGSGEIQEYVDIAKNNNFEVLGISEHLPLEQKELKMAMRPKLTEHFFKELEKVIDNNQELVILKGLECEYDSSLKSYIIQMRDDYKIDYLVLGQHFDFKKYVIDQSTFFKCQTDDDVKRYAQLVVEGLNSGLFEILAHPDVVFCNYGYKNDFDKYSMQIIQAAVDNNVCLELNANGFKNSKSNIQNSGYPNPGFWKVAKDFKDLKVLLSSDAHCPEELIGPNLQKAIKFASEYDISLISWDEYCKKYRK